MSREAAIAWQEKLQQAQDVTAKAAKQELSKAYSQAFASYVRAGELYLWLVRNIEDRKGGIGLASSSTSSLTNSTDAEIKERLRKAAAKVLGRAEKIKELKSDVKPVERQMLSQEEQSFALSTSSTINGLTFPLWIEPRSDEFDSDDVFCDQDPQPALTPAQIAASATFKRSKGLRKETLSDETSSDQEIAMYEHDVGGFGRQLLGNDIVQDIVTDCSFVTALEVAAEHDRRWGTKLATSALYPKAADGSIRKSKNGKYVVRLIMNGAARRVTIDDSLPCYPDGRLMCATSRKDQQTWPALLEKAYLKVMGGYDFLGSNSSIDLHALTGWVPEHIFMRHAGFQREKMWRRICDAWKKGHCMITAGTGKFEDDERSWKGLVPSHDYAVLELREVGSLRYVLLMNPWSRALVERPEIALRHPPSSWTQEMRESLSEGSDASKGNFWVTWDDLCSYFDSIYLNWSPDLFSHSLSAHSIWKGTEEGQSFHGKSVGQNPQFRLKIENRGSSQELTEVWLLLVRHLKDKTKETHYMALHVFEHEEQRRIYQPRSGVKLGTYVDGTHNLIRLTASSEDASYTVVVSRHGPNKDVGYTLSAYSSCQLTLHELPRAHPYRERVTGAWSGRSAGGNITYPTFMHNPQFKINIPPPSAAPAANLNASTILLLLESSKELPVQVSLVWSGGERISTCVEGDVVVTSGMYNHGLAVCERSGLKAGTYTLVLSTFEPNQEGPFSISVECSSPFKMSPIPQEGAGMYHRTLRDRWVLGETAGGSPSNGRFASNPTFILKVTNPSLFQIRLLPSARTCGGNRPYANLAIFEASPSASTQVSQPPARMGLGREVASSGAYADHVCGVAIEGARLLPGTYLMIASTFAPDVEGDFVIEAYSDRPIDVTRP
ncbi:hypothetical protein IE53DRAFT_383488 [Violaceomyces palustris]|uniref:Uncharacterized protein n=1 Tax=Violaceomyces palustris TaxID=1673888 RepID=A0ACD0P7E6_9BASI|nr:hypothetical protein IE53DRAFT_383488 [Violaceomyces palustris]